MAANNPLLEHFWKLAAVDEEERVTAAAALVLNVLEAQQSANAVEGADVHNQCPALVYTLKRLVRGLSSGRKAARQGYCTALTQLLHCFPLVKLSEVFDLIEQHIDLKPKQMKQQELRDAYFGRIFGLMALVRSGRLLGSKADMDLTRRVVVALVTFSSERIYLTDLCLRALLSIIEGLKGSQLVALFDVLGPAMQPDEASAFSVALVFACRKHKSALRKAKLNPESKWPESNLLCKAASRALSLALGDCGSSLPKIHPAWEMLLTEVLKPENRKMFREFWSNCVDKGLYGKGRATHDRRALGYALTCHVFPHITEKQVPEVLTAGLLTSLVANLAAEQNVLNPAARNVASVISKVAVDSDSDDFRLAVIAVLAGENGTKRFDVMSKTKTISTVLSGLTLEGVHAFVAKLKNTFMSGDADTRSWVLDQMHVLVRHPRVPHDEEWPMDVAKFLFVYGFFSVESSGKDFAKPDSEVSEAVAKLARTRFFSVLSDLSTAGPYTSSDDAAPHKKALVGTTADGVLRAYSLFEFVVAVRGNASLTPLNEFSEEHEAVFDRIGAALKKVRKRLESRKKSLGQEQDQARAFEVLFLQIGLQMYQDPSDVLPIVDDLEQSFELFFKTSKKSKTPKKKKAQSTEMEQEPSAVLMDILLSFLAKSSALLRTVVKSVFRAFCGQIGAAGLQLILDAIQQEDAIAMETESANEDDEEEEPGMNGNHGGSDDEESDDQSDSSDDDSDDDSDEEAVDPEFRRKVAEELGVNETANSDSGDGSDDDSDWDDEKMMQIDKALSAHFRLHRSSKKKDEREEKLQRMHFKLRVSDLLEVFLKEQSGNPLVVELVLPLVATIVSGSTDSKAAPLVERLRGLLKNKLCNSKTLPKEVNFAGLHEILAELFAMLSNKPHVVEVVQYGIAYVLRVLTVRGADEPMTSLGHLDWEQASELLNGTVVDFGTIKNNRIPESFLTMVFKRFPAIGWHMVPTVLACLPKAVNDYRRQALCNLIGYLLQPGLASHYVEPLKENASSIQEALSVVLETNLESNSKTKHLREALKVCDRLQRVLKTRAADHVANSCLSDVLQKVAESSIAKKSPAVKRSAETLLVLTKVAALRKDGIPKRKSVKAKAKKEVAATASDEDDEEVETPKPKRRNQRNARPQPNR